MKYGNCMTYRQPEGALFFGLPVGYIIRYTHIQERINRMKRLFVWKTDIYLERIIFSNMTRNNPNYDPYENNKALISLLMEHMPGNTLDLFFEIIESKVKELQALNPDMIQERYFISNHIKSAFQELLESDYKVIKG